MKRSRNGILIINPVLRDCECVDEYSIVVANIALKHTDIPVYYLDERLLWFVDDNERMHKADEFPEHDRSALRLTQNAFDMGYTKRDWSTIGSVAAFQNLFFWQYFTAGKKGPFKYVEVVLSQITGIGGILSYMSMISNASSESGYEAFLRPGCTRYPEDLLCWYFRINPH